MKLHTIDSRTLLSTLWAFVLFNMVFRDLHQFLNHDALQAMIEMDLAQEQVLLYAFVLEIPIAMVLLSRLLPPQANRWANLGAVSLTLLGLLSTLPTADLDDIFFMVIKAAALLAIARLAWGGLALPLQRQTA